jgi:hypothetical protein
MRFATIFLIIIFVLLNSCESKEFNDEVTLENILRFEKISYFRYQVNEMETLPFQYRLTYYFDNGLPHRWMQLDSTGSTQIDYIYEYDSLWKETGAKYLEPGETSYSKEIITFKNDSTKITEWPDSTGTVFYTMIDNLNKAGKTYRATFIGKTTDGVDSTFYTKEGFEKRIFFTNNKGKIFNDRSYIYDSINRLGDWIVRKKIMNDTVREIQLRELSYSGDFNSKEGIFFEGIISSFTEDENVISFSANEDFLFFTRTSDWLHQTGYISKKENGIYMLPEPVPGMDSIYNGAISPQGDRILYSTRIDDKNEIWLQEKIDNKWQTPVNLTVTSDLEGGYFHWLSDDEIYFYIPANNGDIVQGQLKDNVLSIIDSISVLNTSEGTEFSPFMDRQKRFLIFTRYLNGETPEQGFFISHNTGTKEQPIWAQATKIEGLPYGWSANILDSSKVLIYSNGEDIFSSSLDSLAIIPNEY